MKNFLHATLVAGMLAAAVIGVTGVAAAESASSTTVGTTISRLASKGYRVLVFRVGSAPIDQCSVSRVRPGSTLTRTVPGTGSDHATSVVSKSVYLDLVC